MKPVSNFPSFIAAFIVAGTVGQLTACGQTGPLYLPPKPKAISTPAPPDASQEKQSTLPQTSTPVTK